LGAAVPSAVAARRITPAVQISIVVGCRVLIYTVLLVLRLLQFVGKARVAALCGWLWLASEIIPFCVTSDLSPSMDEDKWIERCGPKLCVESHSEKNSSGVFCIIESLLYPAYDSFFSVHLIFIH
jgi:hypothetical protein